MPIELDWYLPSRIILAHVIGNPNIEEMKEFGEALHNMMQEGIAPIHLLFEDSEGGKPPIDDFHELSSMLKLAQHDSFGWVVAIGETNASINFLAPLILRVLKVDFQRFETKEAALSFLKEQDASLQDL